MSYFKKIVVKLFGDMIKSLVSDAVESDGKLKKILDNYDDRIYNLGLKVSYSEEELMSKNRNHSERISALEGTAEVYEKAYASTLKNLKPVKRILIKKPITKKNKINGSPKK